MVIQWHTSLGESDDTIFLGNTSVVGAHTALEQTLVHKVSLENLEPNTDYAFRIGANPKVYKFRTAPAHLDEPLRFLIGGDIYNQTKRLISATISASSSSIPAVFNPLKGSKRSGSTKPSRPAPPPRFASRFTTSPLTHPTIPTKAPSQKKSGTTGSLFLKSTT
jgi:hypothetical protein